jgi:tetratricopeptide (TPR) repeat protein
LDEAAKARAAALDGQFAALKAAGSEEAAATIVAEIWSLWMQSGDAAIDEMIREASVAMSVGAAIRADRLLEEILKRRPDYAEAWNKRATLRFLQRRFEESLADCLEVLNREPRHFGALAGMGLIAIEQDNFKAALAAFRRAQAIHPFLGERALIPALEQKVEGRAL